MERDAILDGLNSEQRRAAETVRGPVCILAGAGSGKTTTITRRIANQVATAAFQAGQILAVTFTDKAATELRTRLAALGATGVTARTFHSAALAQLRYFAGDRVGGILGSKALLLRQIGNTLPGAFRFRPAGDLATEVEWAKNRRLTPGTYLDGLGEHSPPIPPDLMARVFREYERRKSGQGLVDFEDLLALTIALYDEDEWALGAFRERYRAFTVDEYQDVNLLQQTLLDRWLGASDELCAVGDDYQAIYSFTGATPEYLLALPQRFPHATIVRLEENYRSTPEVLELTNRLVPQLGGAEKQLRATKEAGPAPELRRLDGPADEARFLVERIKALDMPLEEMAILLRTNARSADFEETLHAAEIPFQGASLLAREAARSAHQVRRRRSFHERRGSSAGCRFRRTASASASRRGRPTSLGSSRWRSGSTTSRNSRWSWSGSSAPAPRAASICSRSTARRGSSSTPSSFRDSRRASCRSARRRRRPPSPRSAVSSTSA